MKSVNNFIPFVPLSTEISRKTQGKIKSGVISRQVDFEPDKELIKARYEKYGSAD